jgi:hypothetical protein
VGVKTTLLLDPGRVSVRAAGRGGEMRGGIGSPLVMATPASGADGGESDDRASTVTVESTGRRARSAGRGRSQDARR